MGHNWDWEPEMTPEQLKEVEEKRVAERKLIRNYVNGKEFKRLHELRLKYAELRELEHLESKLEYFLHNNSSYLPKDDKVFKLTKSGL
jgi:hypothetical protein